MKKLVLIMACLVSMPTWSASTDKDADQNCRKYLEMAEVIMYGRNNGIPLSKALEFNDQVNKKYKDKNMEFIMRSMIVDAYKQPTYYSEKMKTDQLNEFATKYYLGCIEILK
ncbi:MULTISPECIES: hypothetical protein [Acinetobacter]|uniref:hypothetical protein n=1 Tax=Acinetobacter TaxID=469 RepID=UPI0013B07302|nr:MULTISPECIES: hypothetical protein [Acinetobacter]QIC63312.1 hypothetical protein FSC11_02590 [Acinetobacter schindleri]BCT88166.1 hypothetical protein RYU24_05710 [Acinetobacter variabilis]